MVRTTERARILIADGDGAALARAAQRLDRAGYDVLVACDGERALELARGEHPDACVLDAMLPKLTGYDVTRRLRADATTRALPVLLLTALPLEATAFDPGADAYMRKPFSPQDLTAHIAALLAPAARRGCG